MNRIGFLFVLLFTLISFHRVQCFLEDYEVDLQSSNVFQWVRYDSGFKADTWQSRHLDNNFNGVSANITKNGRMVAIEFDVGATHYRLVAIETQSSYIHVMPDDSEVKKTIRIVQGRSIDDLNSDVYGYIRENMFFGRVNMYGREMHIEPVPAVQGRSLNVALGARMYDIKSLTDAMRPIKNSSSTSASPEARQFEATNKRHSFLLKDVQKGFQAFREADESKVSARADSKKDSQMRPFRWNRYSLGKLKSDRERMTEREIKRENRVDLKLTRKDKQDSIRHSMPNRTDNVRICELFAWVDYSFISYMGSIEAAFNEIHMMVQAMDRYFFERISFFGDHPEPRTQYRFLVRKLKAGSKSKTWSSIWLKLRQFAKIRHPFCGAILFTYESFEQDLLPKVAVSTKLIDSPDSKPTGFCAPQLENVEYVDPTRPSTNRWWKTLLYTNAMVVNLRGKSDAWPRFLPIVAMAREALNMLGASFDMADEKECQKWLIDTIYDFSWKMYSPSKCAIRSVAKWDDKRAKNACFARVGPPVCGNHIREGSEEACDCGNRWLCDVVEPCCDPNTCKRFSNCELKTGLIWPPRFVFDKVGYDGDKYVNRQGAMGAGSNVVHTKSPMEFAPTPTITTTPRDPTKWETDRIPNFPPPKYPL